jgi:AraC-like DNA-binding protein
MRGEFRVVRVDDGLHDACLEELGVRPGVSPYPARPQHDPLLAREFTGLFRAVGSGERLETQERLFAFLDSLFERAARPKRARPGNSRAVRRARDLIHVGFESSLSLDDLARAAGTEKFALLRAFSAELGITPHAYLVQVRMARACRLIARGVPLVDVALAVGYSQQSALARPFRRLVGVTPGAYARAVR